MASDSIKAAWQGVQVRKNALLRGARYDSAEEFPSHVRHGGPDPDVELVLAGLILNLGGPVTVTDGSFA